MPIMSQQDCNELAGEDKTTGKYKLGEAFKGTYGLKYVAINAYRGYCVMRANPGDLSVPLVGASSGCVKFNNTSRTCSTFTSYTNMTEYSGCNRTLCTWTAANAICAAYNTNATLNPNKNDYYWRLPQLSELANWNNTTSPYHDVTLSGDSSGGLNLCDRYADSSRTAKCFEDSYNSSCPGDYCSTSYVWSGVKYYSYLYYYYSLSGGGWSQNDISNNSGLSVRCLLE